jgi:nucleoside-diphosphate-sugar epimerase
MDLSLYGSTGIIGSYFRGLFPSLSVPRDLLTPGSKRVLYLISTTDNATFKEDPLVDVNTNLVELMRRLDACREAGVKEFNFVSSWFVYGPTHRQPHEYVDCKPRGFYSITKYTAEQLVKEYCEEFKIGYRILRLGNVYGGPDPGTPKRNALHFLISRLKKKESIRVMNYVTRDFIHILDVCRAIALICSLGELNSIYNIGTGKATELFKAVEYANALLGNPADIYRFDPPHVYNQAIRFSLDCGFLNNLGFEPIFDIYQGLEDLCLHQKFCTPDRTLMEKKLKQRSKP